MKYVTTIGEKQFTIDINQDGQVTVDGQVICVDTQRMLDTTMYSVIIDGVSHDVRMSEGEGVYRAEVSGDIFEAVVEDERTRRLAGLKGGAHAGESEIIVKAPMPGVVIDVLVSPGQDVEQDDILLVLESMKMQNEFKAPRSGKIHTIRVAPGDKVEQSAVMLTIK
jgi:biotin carboxyl carrier protein